VKDQILFQLHFSNDIALGAAMSWIHVLPNSCMAVPQILSFLCYWYCPGFHFNTRCAAKHKVVKDARFCTLLYCINCLEGNAASLYYLISALDGI